MNEVTEGQDVVVIDRRHPLSYEEGKVTRAKSDPDGRVRVHFPTVNGEPQNPDDWRAIELSVLGPVPHAGERYEWANRNNAPFTVGTRFPRGHMYAGLFPLLHDDANTADRAQGWDSIANAAEVAKFADRTHTPALRFPPGTPEYVAYQAALTEELEKFARGEAPYALERVREHLDEDDATTGATPVVVQAPTVPNKAAAAERLAAAVGDLLSVLDRKHRYHDDVSGALAIYRGAPE